MNLKKKSEHITMEMLLISVLWIIFLTHINGQRITSINITMKNITKTEGASAEFNCDVLGDNLTDYKWFKNDQEISMDDGRTTILPNQKGGKLSIQNLNLQDVGWYTCQGNDGKENIQTKGFLMVKTADCYRNTLGRWYIGKVNITISGRVCQPWGTQTPHRHRFGWLYTEKNYCRNPDDESVGPWCYTMDTYKRWESCGLKKCTDEFDLCSSMPCQNGGTCNSIELNDNSKKLQTYNCTCRPGWTGKTCKERVPWSACNISPCKNGGTCIESKTSFTCRCPSGYIGPTCGISLKTDLCDSQNYWNHYGNQCYKVFDTKLSWEDAVNMCRFMDAELPVVMKANIQQALTNISSIVQADLWTGITSHQGVWVDSQYKSVNLPKFYWTFGASVSPTNDTCIVVKESKDSLNWVTQDCKLKNFFACSRPEGTCPSGWVFHQRICYKYINTLQTSWYNAGDYCRNMDSILLDIPDFDVQIFVHNLVQRQESGIENDNRLWLNLKKNSYGDWIWDSRSIQPAYTNWFNDTKNIGFDCAYIDVGRNGKWFADIPCTSAVSTLCYMEVGSANWKKNMMKDENKGNKTLSECGEEWTDSPNGDSCYLLQKEMFTWSVAEDNCTKVGAHLLSIDNAREQGYITGFLQSSTEYVTVWIGANSRGEGKGFSWSDGSPFSFYNWFPEQPDGQMSGTEECVAMFSRNGKWSDVSCSQRHSSICEKRRPSRTIATTSPPTNNGSGKICPDGWKSYKDNCFLVERQKMTWNEASQFCRNNNGFLASVVDQAEQNFLFSQLPSDYCFNVHPNDTHCSEMAAAGKCTDDLLYMVKQCPAACKKCNRNCTDVLDTENCQAYASQNGCENNPEWMVNHCGKTCGACNAVIYGGFWIGLRDLTGNTFTWENHDEVSFSLWREAEPQGYISNQEGCTAMAYSNGLWFDRKCDWIMPGLICKAPKQKKGITSYPGCRENYVSYASMCYKFSTEEVTWSEAQARCETQHGHLATVNNQYVQAFLSSQLIGKNGNFWIGYKETKSNDTITMWNSGHVVDFRFGDVLDSTSFDLAEGCAAMTTTIPAGIWSFKNCTTKQNYVCENLRDGYTTSTVPTTTTPPLICPSEWLTINNHCFKVFGDNLSWTRARAYCRGIGADLASIHSYSESTQLSTITYGISSNDFWFGLNDREKESDWRWSDGTPSDYTRWMSSQPDNWQGNENCGTYKRSNRRFNDRFCAVRLPFICKVKKGGVIKDQFQLPTLEKCDDEDFVRFNGSCYKINKTKTSFHQAQKICRQNDAELASIHSQEENIFLSDISWEVLWIGLVRSQNDGFRWTDATPVDFTRWSPGEPNDHLGLEGCSHIKKGGMWNDINCGTEIAGFICKKRKASDSGKTSSVVIKGGCPSQYIPSPYNSKCYKLVTNAKSWSNAKSDCKTTKGGSMLSVGDQIEQEFVTSMLKDIKQSIWIGLRKVGSTFVWENNQEVKFTNWGSGEPSGYSYGQSRYCAVVQSKFGVKTGKWKTTRCSDSKGYICETLKDPTIAVNTTTQCPSNYIQYKRSCYKFYSDITLDWDSADHHCRLDNGTLASISTVYEFGFIQAIGLQFNMKTFWIGLRKANTSALYQWSNGLSYLYTNWNKSEPSQKLGYDCVLSHDNKWKDMPCKSRLPYLCEKSLDKLPLPPPTECPTTAYAFNGACYHVELKQKGSWTDAQQMCQKYGMTLASIHSIVEIEHLREFAVREGATRSVWIGLSRRRLPSDPIGKVNFYWSDRSTVDFTYWNAGEPSDSLLSSHEECTEMYVDGTWNDAACSKSLGFVCKDDMSKKMEVTTVVNDVTNATTSTDANTTASFNHTTQSFSSTTLRAVKSPLASSTEKKPKLIFAIVGVCIGLLILTLAAGTIGYAIKKRKRSASSGEVASPGFENAMYRKDSGILSITDS
ncbi:macrophage mannose receptor 1-like isoform X1 [Ostrea edulis]|uniref:macrophage mannose receptor 1-like isoform X1 n=1 Tax=Ostrea edulis TaxID=37623 RepID=UPI0024AF1065|nr:macrophage mannose receptor 1-like isoform X1 [Ostrea edulis]